MCVGGGGGEAGDRKNRRDGQSGGERKSIQIVVDTQVHLN